MRRVTAFILGAFLGGLVTSSIVLLMTPQSGKGLQDQIKSYVDNVVGEVKQAATDRRAQLEIQLAQLRGEVISE